MADSRTGGGADCPPVRPSVLPLTKLEPLPGAWATRLLPLHGPRIAGQEPGGPALGPVLAVGTHQGPRNPEAQRARLSGLAAPVHVGPHIEGAEGVGGGQRLLDVLHQRGAGEIIAQGAALEVPRAGAGGQIPSGDTGLAATHRLPAEFGGGGHALTLDGVTENGLGCCAACGCSAPAYTLSLPRSFCRASEVLGSMPKTAFSMTRSGCLASRSRAAVIRSWPM